MAWITPKMNWVAGDSMNLADLNRIENNILELDSVLRGIEYSPPPLADNNFSLSFDGVDDYVDLGSPSALNITGDLTLEAWVYLTKDTTSSIIMSWANVGYTSFPYHWIIISSNGCKPRLNLNTAGVFDATSPVPLNVWTHLSVTVSGTTVTFYYNGSPDGSYTTTGARSSGNAFLSISVVSTPFKGQIDEPRIWNVARTQAQIAANMRTNLLGTETGLVGYWKCFEGQGTTLTPTTGTAFGTLTNGTTWSTNKPYAGTRKNWKVGDIPFLSDINRVETNLDNLRSSFFTPGGYLSKKTWTVGKGFSFDDANRLESNTNLLRDIAALVPKSYRYCGAYTCGDTGALY